jgi:hypothetical protein
VKLALKNGETVTLKVELLAGKLLVVQDGKVVAEQPVPLAPTLKNSLERRSIEWVLKMGGVVNMPEKSCKQISDLPSGQLRPNHIALPHSSAMGGLVETVLTDADLEHLRHLPDSVRHFDLRNHAYTDAGIQQLTGFPFAAKLAILDVRGPHLTDAALDHIDRCRELEEIRMASPNLTGTGFQKLRGLPRLRNLGIPYSAVQDAALADLVGLRLHHLELRGAQVTNEGMKHLAGLIELQGLGLYGAAGVSDAGVAHLTKLQQLRGLDLGGTQTTDEGLKLCAKLPLLTTLFLPGTMITDAGVDTLSTMKSLTHLIVNNTKISAGGLAKLRKALPKCKVDG